MVSNDQHARGMTSTAQHILEQLPSRAGERGLLTVDDVSIVTLTLWSLLCWERKVGVSALERMRVDRFGLARDVDRLLIEARGEQKGKPHEVRDFGSLTEPLLQQAQHEAEELGHTWVGSEHLLLAIVRMADPVLAASLQQHHVNHERVKESVEELVGLRP